MRKHTISFINAFNGLSWAFRTQPNFKIHLVLTILALIGSFLLKVSYFEFLIILVLIFMGLVIEIINTSIEAIVDLVSPEIRNEAKVAKDVSAAAVLIASIASVFIAAFLFLSRLSIFL